MGISLAYTLNISSSSKSLKKSRSYTVDISATLYDRREKVSNIWASSHIFSGLLKSSAF
jgi:hypothetical protein